MRQQQKSAIQEQEGCLTLASVIFAICVLVTIFYLFTSVTNRNSPSDFFSYFFIFIIVAIPLAIWQQAIRHQKKAWMKQYGQQIMVTVTRRREEEDTNSDGSTRSTTYYLYLEWHDPHTGKVYHYKITVPQSDYYRYKTGSQFPMWVDPHDPKFHYPS